MHTFAAGYRIRPLSVHDAPALTDAMLRNRHHLAPWSPRRANGFYSLAGQEAELARHLRGIEDGQQAVYVVVHEDQIVGRINVQNIVRGAFHSADLGYWVDRDRQGKGLATAAVQHACQQARVLGLHRLGAATLLHNAASQAVLLRNGFHQVGRADDYLFIDGAWRDHNLYQRILHHDPLQLV